MRVSMSTVEKGSAVAAGTGPSYASSRAADPPISVRGVSARNARGSLERFHERALEITGFRYAQHLGVVERLAVQLTKCQPPSSVRGRGPQHVDKVRDR